jgi:hypothetical protein
VTGKKAGGGKRFYIIIARLLLREAGGLNCHRLDMLLIRLLHTQGCRVARIEKTTARRVSQSCDCKALGIGTRLSSDVKSTVAHLPAQVRLRFLLVRINRSLGSPFLIYNVRTTEPLPERIITILSHFVLFCRTFHPMSYLASCVPAFSLARQKR